MFGIVIILVGIAAINGHAGNLINSRPDALVPLIVLGVGLVALVVATRRVLNGRDKAESPDEATQ